MSPQKHRASHITEANLSLYSDYAIGCMAEESRFDSRQEQDCFLLRSVQTSSKAHPTSNSLCTEESLLGIKQLQYEAAHSPPSSTKLRNKWNFIFSPPISLYGAHRDYYTFDECHIYITVTNINTPVAAVLIGTEEIPMLDGCNGVNPGFKDEMEKACCVCDVAGGEARDDRVTLNGCCCCPVALF